jgi:hypothetical protein
MPQMVSGSKGVMLEILGSAVLIEALQGAEASMEGTWVVV